MIELDDERQLGGKGLAIARVAFVAILVVYLGFLVSSQYEITWLMLGWTLLYAILYFAISYYGGSSGISRERGGPLGLFTLKTIFLVLVVVYLLWIPDSTAFIDNVASKAWPIFIGVGIGWLLKLILELFRN